MLRSLALTTALAMALAVTTIAAAATGPITVQATHQPLALKLTVQSSGSTVTAKASLRNRGSAPWKYYGACVPPILQIQATDAGGNHLYGWTPPQVTCLALSIRYLAPGASIKAKATFEAHGAIRVWALVPVPATSAVTVPPTLFHTRKVKLDLP